MYFATNMNKKSCYFIEKSLRLTARLVTIFYSTLKYVFAGSDWKIFSLSLQGRLGYLYMYEILANILLQY